MGAEKRRFPRAPLLASAVLHKGPQPIGNFRVINASAGGLLLAGRVPDGLDDQVEIVVRLPADRIVRGKGTVVRVEVHGGRPAFAVSFVDLRSDQESILREAVVAAIEESRTASVLVLDGDLEASCALRESIRRIGYQSFAVASFLEFVHALQYPNNFSSALVDAQLPGPGSGWADGPEILEYLAHHHPGVRRVLMVGNVDPPPPEGARNAAAPEWSHYVLPKPCTDSALARALERSPAVESR